MRLQDFIAAARHQDGLTAEAMRQLGGMMLAGAVESGDLAAFLRLQAERGPTPQELTGLAQALRADARPFPTAPGALDVCGTGGTGRTTPNISTAVALTVAACGVPVVKHGNRAVTGTCGSADVLEALGIKIDAPPERMQQALMETKLCFLYAPHYHPAMRHVAEARKLAGRRTIFNLVGPLVNPAQPQRQLLGVFSRFWLQPMAETLNALGGTDAWIVHSRDGLDELSTMAVTDIVALHDGVTRNDYIDPAALDLPAPAPDSLHSGGDAQHNAALLRALLDSVPGAFQDIVVLNAAAALVIAGRCCTLRDGMELAREALSNGAAHRVLTRLAAISNGPTA